MTTYLLPDLPYDFDALEPHVSARVMELHHSKHHKAYVDGANMALEKLKTARAAEDLGAIVGLEKNLAFNVSGHMLHSLYWQNLSPHGGGEPIGSLHVSISQHFGSFASFKAQLTEAVVTIQGSGWGALVWEPIGKTLLVEQIYDHQSNAIQGVIPLLAIDAWEHSYYLQYENRRPEYAAAIWNVIN